jgi:hypothetical protein
VRKKPSIPDVRSVLWFCVCVYVCVCVCVCVCMYGPAHVQGTQCAASVIRDVRYTRDRQSYSPTPIAS